MTKDKKQNDLPDPRLAEHVPSERLQHVYDEVIEMWQLYKRLLPRDVATEQRPRYPIDTLELGQILNELSALRAERELSERCDEPKVVTDDGRPNFAAFAKALRAEKRWSAELHGADSGGDQASLEHLARDVEKVAEKLGFGRAPT